MLIEIAIYAAVALVLMFGPAVVIERRRRQRHFAALAAAHSRRPEISNPTQPPTHP
jgi:hypothetical protein